MQSFLLANEWTFKCLFELMVQMIEFLWTTTILTKLYFRTSTKSWWHCNFRQIHPQPKLKQIKLQMFYIFPGEKVDIDKWMR